MMMLIRGVIVGAFASLMAAPVMAEKWYIEPIASVRFGYEDNVRLSTSDEEDAFSAYLNIKAPFGFRTEVSDVNLSAELQSRRFDGLSDLDTDDQILGLDAVFRSTRNIFSLQGSYTRNSTRTSELETTGLVQTSKRRIGVNLNPSWTLSVTERTSLQLGYQHTDVSYEDADLTTLTDYRYGRATVGLAYKLSEKTELYGNLSGSRYDAPDADTEFETYQFQVGVNRNISERLSANASLGYAHTESEFLDSGGSEETSSEDTILLDLRIKRISETMIVEGFVNASETPSSRGRLLRKNAVGISLLQKLSPRTAFTFRGELYENTSAGGFDDDSDDRLYYFLEPGLNWRATNWWTISSAYRYRNQEYTNSTEDAAESNALFITIRYVWPKE